jgi:hypothetical protein
MACGQVMSIADGQQRMGARTRTVIMEYRWVNETATRFPQKAIEATANDCESAAVAVNKNCRGFTTTTVFTKNSNQ